MSASVVELADALADASDDVADATLTLAHKQQAFADALDSYAHAVAAALEQQPPPEPEPEPPSGTLIWEADHDSKTYGFPDGVAAKSSDRYGQVDDPLGVYAKVWHVQVRPGDNNVQGSGSGERCEGLATIGEVGDKLRGREGQRRYFAWDVVYGAGYAPNGSDWNNTGQWHNSGTSGSTCATITPSGELVLVVPVASNASDFATTKLRLLERIVTGKRYELAIRWDWSADPAKGGVAAWLDGVNVVPYRQLRTLYENQTTYPKLGNYRTAQSFVADLFFHGYRCADSLSMAVAGFTKTAHGDAWQSASAADR